MRFNEAVRLNVLQKSDFSAEVLWLYLVDNKPHFMPFAAFLLFEFILIFGHTKVEASFLRKQDHP